MSGLRKIRYGLCLKILKTEGVLFCNIEKFSKKRYIRYTLHPEFVISSMGCVIVEGDTLALFTVQKYADC